MKRKTNSLLLTAFFALSLTLTASAQSIQFAPDSQSASAAVRTNSKILYHDGPVKRFRQSVYFIYYGCWTSSCGTMGEPDAVNILNEFTATVGNTPYMGINSTYTDSAGNPATTGLIWAGMVIDSSYSHGADLTKSDIEGIISDQILGFTLPQDPEGIYVVVSSADIASNATGFCIQGAPPFHSASTINGGLLSYIYLGNPNRCRTIAGAPFGSITPNANFAGDAMVANLTHALNGLLTNPFGNGWYDRYGLENADKCSGTFGQTYTTANGAPANIRLGSRDFLIEQNWVNNRKPFCAMHP